MCAIIFWFKNRLIGRVHDKYLCKTIIDFTIWEATWISEKRACEKHCQRTLQAADPHLSDLGGGRLANVALPIASFTLRHRVPMYCQEYPDRKLIYIMRISPTVKGTPRIPNVAASDSRRWHPQQLSTAKDIRTLSSNE